MFTDESLLLEGGLYALLGMLLVLAIAMLDWHYRVAYNNLALKGPEKLDRFQLARLEETSQELYDERKEANAGLGLRALMIAFAAMIPWVIFGSISGTAGNFGRLMLLDLALLISGALALATTTLLANTMVLSYRAWRNVDLSVTELKVSARHRAGS